MLAETAQQWYQDAEMKGRQEGRQEGIAIGEVKGEARGKTQGELAGLTHSLVTILKAKFGELPENAYSQINPLEKAQLERCLERVLSAETLEDVF